MIEFVNETLCCLQPCDGSLIDSITCLAPDWQDGICDDFCNIAACGYDGGDCNQLCVETDVNNQDGCFLDMLGDGICDSQCNTTNCEWDIGDCIDITAKNESTFCYNETVMIDFFNDTQIIGCYDSWVDDGWCDSLCFANNSGGPYCNYDGTDCADPILQCSDNCEELYIIFEYADVDASDLVSSQEVCDQWTTIDLYFNLQKYNVTQCEGIITLLDANNDSLVSMHELIIGIAPEFDLTYEKALQVDCSVCLSDPSKY